MPRRIPTLRIAVDTGGTFTDCVWVDPASGKLRMLKVFSTPTDPSQAIVDAIRKIAHEGDLILLHGTTVGTNTLLERKGARTALVTTAGFEDAIEIGRQARAKLYDFFFDRVEPLVERDLRFGVEERTARDDEILTAVSAEDLKSLVTRVAAAQPQAVAISLLFSFANPKNERAVAEALKPLGIPLSISHEILPEFREYERTSTVVVNAYLQPVMKGYLENLQYRANRLAASESKTEAAGAEAPIGPGAVAALKRRSSTGRSSTVGAPCLHKSSATMAAQGTQARIFVMQSNGGIAALAAAAREPVRTVLSGPAGGVIGAAATARASGFERVIAFDMGGTSTDVSLVDGAIAAAAIPARSDAQVAGLPVGVPMLDIHTVGAGGGSLARFDAGGVLRVGPESAGADPGPICYGRGVQPTVTDANLLLGRLRAERFLGGEFKLDVERTRTITQAWLKKQKSRLTLEQFADGVIRVVNATMEKAIRVVSVERGRDPRDYALVAFGGAGGLHACALAEALGIPQVIVPALPGALSALGILASDVVKDYSRTVLWRVSGEIPHAGLRQEFSRLEKQAAKVFEQEGWPGKARHEKSVDVRYRGQGYELSIPLSKNLLQEFEREHQRRYGYVHPNREVELVTLRLRAVVKTPPPRAITTYLGKMDVSKTHHVGTGTLTRPGRATLGSPSSLKARVLFNGRKLETKIYSREALHPGRKCSSPAIITEYSATTVIPPGKRFHLDRAGNLIITI
ncbi:MAG: hydantoinase/oxoprolinase family protein [Candidatus Sulfotelmatobacter sp.]